MTRASFETVVDVSVKDLRLDISNARIRHGADQADCITRIAKGKEDQLVALATDIAENGLSTAPILAKRQADSCFVVWDGNRRVTALKLLDDPTLAPDPALRKRFENIKARHPSISATVDILVSSDDEALFKEVIARHGGGLEGAGQLVWSSLMRTFFLTSHNHPSQDRRAALLFLWGEEHGVSLPDDFPITNITRFLTKANLARLGFTDSGATVEPEIPLERAIAVVRRLATDFRRGGMKVNEVFTGDQATAYIDGVCLDLGLVTAPPPSAANATPPSLLPSGRPTAAPQPAPPSASPGVPTNDENQPDRGPAPPTTVGPRPRVPQKPTWDRPRLFRSRSPGFSVPKTEIKASNVVTELGRLKTNDTPFAVAALFRMLVEFSTTHYWQVQSITARADGTHKKIAVAATHMFEAGRINESTKDQILRRTTQPEDMLQYNSLNQFMHAWSAYPHVQQIHVLWDELEPYLIECWRV